MATVSIKSVVRLSKLAVKPSKTSAQHQNITVDGAYRSNPLQMELFGKFKIKLRVPFRVNQHDYKKHPKKYKSKRQKVEKFFAQMGDPLNL